MRNYLLTGLFACLTILPAFSQVPNHVVISQVYGGGGNTGAQYRNDFVELYNPTANAVNLAGWSLQYAAASGNFSSTTLVGLAGMIAPGGYYLVQLGSGGNNGILLPAANVMATFGMANESGKVALVNSSTLLPAGCSTTGNGIVDFVGYGGANCFEGTDGTNRLSNNTAAHRLDNGCWDSNNNANDFLVYGPSPRNASSPVHSCATRISISTVAPVPFCVDAGTGVVATLSYQVTGPLPASLTVFLSDSTGSFATPLLVGNTNSPAASGTISLSIPSGLVSSIRYRLRANGNNAYGVVSNQLEVINGTKNVSAVTPYPDQTEISVQWTPPSGCVDEYLVVAKPGARIDGIPTGDGSAYTANASYSDNGTSFDGGKVVYKGGANSVLVTGLTIGTTYYFRVYSRRGTNWSSGIQDTATTRVIPSPGEVLINGFSPRFKEASDEFYELVNTTGKTFNLADLTLQYQSPQGGTRVPSLVLGNTLLPYSFWLLTPLVSSISIGKTANLQGDFTSGSGISDGGYIALVRRKDNLVVDAVGYGNASGGTFFEGNLAPAIPGLIGAYRRRTDGVDNNNNATDFEVIPVLDIDLRNSTSRLANANARIPGGNYRRIYVTGNSTIENAVNLSEKLVFTSGKLALGNASLAVNTIEGANPNAYVQTNGTGSLMATPPNANAFSFPVGNRTFNPLIISNGNGTQWQVRVQDGVFAIGSEKAVLRTWQVEPSGIPSVNAALSFVYNEADPNQLGINFSSAEGLQVWYRKPDEWIKAGGVVPAITVSGSFRSATLGGYPNFGSFVVASVSAVLPVHFDAVRLTGQEGWRVLHFTAHNERSIDRYEVDWSADGQHFQSIGTLVPRYNNGASGHYSFTDKRPLWGMHYYRIRAIEQDGKLQFSPVVSCKSIKPGSHLLLYPVPVTGGMIHYAMGSLAAGKYRVQVLDAAGRRVWENTIQHHGGSLGGTIATTSLHPGRYILVVSGSRTLVQSFMVQ